MLGWGAGQGDKLWEEQVVQQGCQAQHGDPGAPSPGCCWAVGYETRSVQIAVFTKLQLYVC